MGVVNVDDVNNRLSDIEVSLRKSRKASAPLHVATHMLVLYVRGLVTSLRFPYANFPTTGVSASFLFHIFWEAVRQLKACGFVVLSVTCDSAASNRSFYRLHESDVKRNTDALNRYSQEQQWLYFFPTFPIL